MNAHKPAFEAVDVIKNTTTKNSSRNQALATLLQENYLDREVQKIKWIKKGQEEGWEITYR